MLGQLEQAEEAFNGILSMTPVERWIHKRVRRFLVRRWFQLFPYEIMYVTDCVHSMKKEWLDSALRFLESVRIPPLPESSVVGRFQEADEHALLLLLKGCILRAYGRLREGVATLEQVTRCQSWVLHEKWVVPHAYYELGMIYIKGRDWKRAREQFVKAKIYRSHDFKRSLSFKLKAALDFVTAEEGSEKPNSK